MSTRDRTDPTPTGATPPPSSASPASSMRNVPSSASPASMLGSSIGAAADGAARRRLGPYELILELASGGMATVYVARQIGAAGFQRLVVIKRVHRHLLGDEDFRAMFIDEARVASQIRHPNVVSVTDVVESEGELFLVMEFVESTSLAALLGAAVKRGQRLPPPVAARIVSDMLAGLHAAHEARDLNGHFLDLVHRDVSPQNLLVAIDGTSRLIDFGIAKAAKRLTSTQSGSIKGKLGYLSPEAARGVVLDRRADLFSAGVVLHESLTGRRLFYGENEYDVLMRINEVDAPPPSAYTPGVSPALDAVVRRALARDREQRYPTAADFLDELEAAVQLASPREVRAALEQYCGERLEVRRTELRAALDGAPALGTSIEISSVHTSAVRIPTGDETSAHIASSLDHNSIEMRHGLRRASLIGALLGTVVIGVLLALLLTRSRLPGFAATNAPDRVSAAAATPGGAPHAADSSMVVPGDEANEDVIAVDIVSRDLIEGVSAKGIRRTALSGERARIFITPWKGRLAIEVILSGGRVAKLQADGAAARSSPLELHVPDAPAAGTAGPAASTSNRGAVPGGGRGGAPRGTPAPAGRGDELHDNPYGGGN